jgi:hypothetical protein
MDSVVALVRDRAGLMTLPQIPGATRAPLALPMPFDDPIPPEMGDELAELS